MITDNILLFVFNVSGHRLVDLKDFKIYTEIEVHKEI